jgi:hypothetical protein
MYKVILPLLFVASVSQAESKKEACGQVSFSKNMSCEKAEIYFDISNCDKKAFGLIPATKVGCDKGELTAKLKHNGSNYTAEFVKYLDGTWSQKGSVMRSGKTKAERREEAKAAASAEPIAAKEVSPSPPAPVEKEKAKDDSWKFTFAGFASIEQESLSNFGDAVSANFDSMDSLANQSATSLLSNLQFTMAKENVKFDSMLEIGEVYFGDLSTGGKQGLRSQIIELRNLSVEEKYAKDWYFKVGLWTMNADPRGFVLSDHHAGAQIRNENGSMNTALWLAKAVAGKPGTVVTADTYVGLSLSDKLSNDNSYTLFSTYRSTRETFVDTNLTTSLTGPSTYMWLGLNYIQAKVLEKTNLELNLIANQSQFKADSGGPSDNNSSWLAHARIDREVSSQYSLGVDVLATSGSSFSRVGGVQVLGHRKNYATADPAQAYLLTLATSDGVDDSAGSGRAEVSNHIGRLDLDEGLRIGVISLSKTINEKWDGLLRFGQIQTASENTAAKSTDYGSEVDVKIKFKASTNTSWILEGGVFNPGKYFTNQDNASLAALKYRLDF